MTEMPGVLEHHGRLEFSSGFGSVILIGLFLFLGTGIDQRGYDGASS